MISRKLTLLECTLRDGSYAIDYQFTAEDTAIIAAGLEQAGFQFIEIGHGLGLNASGAEHGIAAATDEEYLETASSVLTNAKFGMFCIPGIARIKDLDLAAKYKMDFVRVGTNVTEAAMAEPFIKRAKELGMTVSSNLMKSYALSLDAFLKVAEQVASYGADIVCVVDSAGGMLPDDVKKYVQKTRETISAQIGFHGHNNLLLAAANSLEAIQAGAEIIDVSMQGMGRSAGNAQTEVMIILLEKLGYETGLDLFKAMDIGERLVKPIMGGLSGVDTISATLGYAQFHSSYLRLIYKMAQKYNIDPRELIVRVSEVDKVKVSEELAENIASKIGSEMIQNPRKKLLWNVNLDFKEVFEKYKEEETTEIARDIALEMMALSKKTGKQSVFTIALTRNRLRRHAAFPFLRQNATYVIGNAEVAGVAQAHQVVRAVDGLVDVVLLDLPLGAQGLKEFVKKSKVLDYRDNDALIRAVDTIVNRLVNDIRNQQILILGDRNRAAKLALDLAERGAQINLLASDGISKTTARALSAISGGNISSVSEPASVHKNINILVAVTPYSEVVSTDMLDALPRGSLVIDAGPGCIGEQAISYGIRKELSLLRIDMRAGLAAEIVNILETDELKEKIMGRRQIDGITVVAGGVIGNHGDIVIDRITEPTRVVGVADGKGKLLGSEEAAVFSGRIRRIRTVIASKNLG